MTLQHRINSYDHQTNQNHNNIHNQHKLQFKHSESNSTSKSKSKPTPSVHGNEFVNKEVNRAVSRPW